MDFAEAIDRLNYIITTSKKNLKPLAVTVLDLSKAFDSINHLFMSIC